MQFSLIRSTTESKVNRRKPRSLQLERMEDRSLMAGLTHVAAPAQTPPAIVSTLQAASGKIASPVSVVQQQNLEKLRADLAAIKAGAQVTPEQIEKLKTDIVTLVQGTTKPSADSVAKLKSDLQTTLSDGKLTKAEQALLANDVTNVLASANVPVSEIKTVVADVQSIIASSGITQTTVATIRADIKAIVTEFRFQHPRRV